MTPQESADPREAVVAALREAAERALDADPLGPLPVEPSMSVDPRDILAALAAAPLPSESLCGEPVALFEVAYGDQYEPCAWSRGHEGNHDPSSVTLHAAVLGMAMDMTTEEDETLGVVGRGRYADRVAVRYANLLYRLPIGGLRWPAAPLPLKPSDTPADGLDAPDIRSIFRDLEQRFWRAESKWAGEGSGMTKDQQTGAHMAFMWLRTGDGGLDAAALALTKESRSGDDR